MNRFILILLAVVFATAAGAQSAPTSTIPTNPQAAKPAAKTATSATKTTPSAASAAKASTTASTVAPWIKLPPGIPKVAHGPVLVPFSLHYEDVKVGAGAEGEAGKIWHIKYTGWLAADGVKFDSWDEHPQPVIGKDGKPELGPDGKPKPPEPQPMPFPQGTGRVIPGFDYGLAGMKIGGKRRIFIPWQLAYGERGRPSNDPKHPGIPAKSDLIFDVELVDLTDMPQRPMMPGGLPHPGINPVPRTAPGAPTGSSAPGTKPSTPTQPATTQTPAGSAPAQTTTPPSGSSPATNNSAPAPPTNVQAQPH